MKKMKIFAYIILLLGFVTYGYAYTPPQSILQKRLSYREVNGMENVDLKGEGLLRLGEFIQYAFNAKMVLSWDSIGSGKYVLNGVFRDDFAGTTTHMKILFSDRKNQDYILIDRLIVNGEEINGRTKLQILKRYVIAAIFAKRQALTGAQEQKSDMSHIPQSWEGGYLDTNVQEEKYFEFTDENAIKKVENTAYFKHLKKTYKNLIVFVEEKSKNYIYLYLGFDEGGYTTRHAFVRVDLLGMVEYTTTPPEDENSWKLM